MTAPVHDNDRGPLLLWTGLSLVLLAVAIAITLTTAAKSSKAPLSDESLLVGLAFIAPYLVILGLTSSKTRRPGGATLGFTYGLSAGVSAMLIVIIIAGIFGRLTAFVTMSSLPLVAGLMLGLVSIATALYELPPLALLLVILFGLAQFQLAKVAKRAYDADSGKTRGWSVGRSLGFAMLGVCGMAAITGQSKAEQKSARQFIVAQEQQRSENMDAYHALLRVQACAATFADSTASHHYPESLTEMGPSGTACLDSAIAGGMTSGYQLRYHPITDSAGRSIGWWMIARRPNAPGADDAFMADHTGALFLRPSGYDDGRTEDEVDSTTTLRQFNSPDLSNWIRSEACIRELFATAGEAGGFPSDLASVKHEDWRRCLVDDKRNRVAWGDYLVSYVPDAPERSGKIRAGCA